MIMNPRKILLLSMAFTAMGTWAQSALGNLAEVDLGQVEIMSVKEVEFGSRDSIVIDPVTGRVDTLFIDEGIWSIKPVEDEIGPARAPRRAPSTDDYGQYGGLTEEGMQLARSGAYLFAYKYPSIDADGNKVILSSMMGVPRAQFQMGYAPPSNVLIACHETITSNFEAPTNYNNEGGSFQTGVGMMLMYTRYDRIRQPCCLVIMPDYEGYGITADRAHPYLYQELTARQVVDAVRYGLALYNANAGSDKKFDTLENDWQSVSLGYSQGGSVALAVHKFIEENGLDEQLHYAGSVCGDGPYDPVAHLRYYITDNGENYNSEDSTPTAHDAGSVTMPIVMPLILKGMCDSNPLMRQHTVDEYLSQKFLSTGSLDMIAAKKNPNRDDQFSTEDVTKRYQWQMKYGLNNWVHLDDPYHTGTGSFRVYYNPTEVCEMFYKSTKPFLLFGDYTVFGKLEQMLTPACYAYFTTESNFEVNGKRVIPTERGFMQDLHRALESNNLTVGWTPKHRIAFYHSSYDTVVPFVNLCSFVKNHPELSYYIKSPSARLSAAGAQPTNSVVYDETKADVYINDTNSTKDHIDAGKNFFLTGNLFGTSPDYELYKWVLKKKQ